MSAGRLAAPGLALAGICLGPADGWSSQLPDFAQGDELFGQGWQGFTDVGFLVNTLLMLALATLLAMVIAYHPKRLNAADTLEEIEAPKVYIMYTVIGAIIGMMVARYGEVVGFVIFGIGGLIRFRTDLRSATLTGQVIFVTLVGLSCGLNLPHVAVLATVFGFALLYILGMRITYRIEVKGLAAEQVAESAAAYREVLEESGYPILSEKKSFEKDKVTFVFRVRHQVTREQLESLFEGKIDEALRGSVDWEIA
jgi:hypothetical protein